MEEFEVDHEHTFNGFLDPNAPKPQEPMGFFGTNQQSKVWFRGGWTCTCVSISLPWVEYEMVRKGLIRNNIDIFQLGYRGDVSASAGTHDKGGNTDVGQYSDAHIKVWRDFGWTIQNRAPFFPGNEHGHGWPWGCTHLASGAEYQITDWKNRKNGLAGHGPVRGPWPVQNWKTALERKVDEMFTPEDIAKQVLELDGEIENVFTGNPDNKYVNLATAVKYLALKQEKQDAKLDAILKALTVVTAATKK